MDTAVDEAVKITAPVDGWRAVVCNTQRATSISINDGVAIWHALLMARNHWRISVDDSTVNAYPTFALEATEKALAVLDEIKGRVNL